jgi:hypothetical protein
MLNAVNQYVESRGIRVSTGTIVDAIGARPDAGVAVLQWQLQFSKPWGVTSTEVAARMS